MIPNHGEGNLPGRCRVVVLLSEGQADIRVYVDNLHSKFVWKLDSNIGRMSPFTCGLLVSMQVARPTGQFIIAMS